MREIAINLKRKSTRIAGTSKLLLAEAESNSDITVVYLLLAQQQHLLNPRFSLKGLQKLAEDLITHQNSETIELIFSLIEI
jgi:hypothetical protein